MALKLLHLMDPDSPGMMVWVMRGWWGQRFYPRHFATLRESLKYRELTRHLDKKTCYCSSKWVRKPKPSEVLKTPLVKQRNSNGVIIS